MLMYSHFVVCRDGLCGKMLLWHMERDLPIGERKLCSRQGTEQVGMVHSKLNFFSVEKSKCLNREQPSSFTMSGPVRGKCCAAVLALLSALFCYGVAFQRTLSQAHWWPGLSLTGPWAEARKAACAPGSGASQGRDVANQSTIFAVP